MYITFHEPDTITIDEYLELFRTPSLMQCAGATILEKHFKCPFYSTTATQLANIMGYSHFNQVNKIYGCFAGRLARQFGWTKEQKNVIGFDWLYFLCIFGEGNENKNGREHRVLTLRPNVVKSLIILGWDVIAL